VFIITSKSTIDIYGVFHHIIIANENHINFYIHAQVIDTCYISNIQPHSQIVAIFI